MFCPSPEIGINIDAQGNITVCCASTRYPLAHLNDNLNWEDFFISDLWLSVKDKVQSGNSYFYCKSCKDKESKGLVSRRLSLKSIYDKPNRIIPIDYFYLDLDIGNTCNLWCCMCNSKWSSKWYTVDRSQRLHSFLEKPFFTPFKFEQRHIDNVIGKIYKRIDKCEIKGGEPFASKHFEYFLNFLHQKNCKHLEFVTNGTILTDHHLSLLSKFNQVHISVSVDAVSDIGQWIRYDKISDWNKVKYNIQRLLELPNVSGTFLVCTMVYNFFDFDNILLELDDLISNNKKWNINPKQIVQDPAILNVNNIVPFNLRMKMVEKIKNLNVNSKIKFIDEWIDYFSRTDQPDEELIEKFHNYTRELNKLKSVDIYQFLPRELQCIN